LWRVIFLRKKLKQVEPDISLSFGEDWNNLVLLSTFGVEKKMIVCDRAEPGKLRKFPQEQLREFLYKFANGIIVQTDKAKTIYQKRFKKSKIIQIGNPIRHIRANENEQKENIILSVGRLVDTKHFDLLIKIFADVDIPKWKLVIVGGDSQKQNGSRELQSLIDDLGLQDRILLTGTVSNVETYYRKSKIFAFTSSSEGFPNVIGEAMSAGLPVVAFDCVAGPAEMIQHGDTGFLIPLFDSEEFKTKLELLMRNKQLRETMGKRGSEVIKKYSIDNIGEKFFKMLLDAV